MGSFFLFTPLFLLLQHARSKYNKKCDDFDSSTNSIFSNNLCGELYLPTDDDAYLTAADQYAASSFPSRVRPSMIIEAVCDEDIKLSISYAKKCGYTIAIRSGGHQYSGLSSCNTSCIQIDMKQYNHIIINGVDDISMGPGLTLGAMYAALDEKDMYLPGGTCSEVGLGGHVQTGGFGHTVRSDGALLDHVLAFDIILSDGESYQITKPDARGEKDKWNDDLYWAVMGGSPGSWGVITNFEFTATLNSETSTSTVSECTWLYDGDLLKQLLRNFIDIHNDEGYLNSPDVGIWFTLAKKEPAGANVMRIQCFWAGIDSKPYNSKYCDQLLNITVSGECATFSMTTSNALRSVWTYYIEREFPLPYIKSHRVSTVNLKYEFIDQYVGRLDDVFLDPTNGLFMISEIVSVGGSGSQLFRNDPDGMLTSLSRREAMISLVTDLFYAEAINPGSKQAAIDWRNGSWNEWFETKTFNEGKDYRMTWSTFENINIEEAWTYYYDAEQYDALKRIKKKVDSMNLSQNEFTIPIDEADQKEEEDEKSGTDDAMTETPHSNSPWRFVPGFQAYFKRFLDI